MNENCICKRCNVQYTEAQNIGRWECAMHTLPYIHKDGYYPCCRKSNLGCIRCDHIFDLNKPYPNSECKREVGGGIMIFHVKKENLEEILPPVILLYNTVSKCILVDPDNSDYVYVLRRAPFSDY